MNVHIYRQPERTPSSDSHKAAIPSSGLACSVWDKAKTTWLRCSIWGKRGESVLPYLVKGQLVGVSGEFSMNEWTNKENQKVSTPEIRVNELDLLGKKSADSSSTHEQKPANSNKAPADGFDDDYSIPF